MKFFRSLKDTVYKRISPLKYAKSLGVKIGRGCRLGIIDWGSEPYLISVGDEVLLSSRIAFVNHDGATWIFRDLPEYKDVAKYGTIRIGNRCFIGWGAVLLPGSEMGDRSALAAGAVLSGKVPSGEIWGGVPAKKIMTTVEFAEKCKSRDIGIRSQGKEKERELKAYFSSEQQK